MSSHVSNELRVFQRFMAIGSAWTCIAEDLRLEMVYALSCVRGFKVAAPPWGRTEQRDNFHPTGIWQTRAN